MITQKALQPLLPSAISVHNYLNSVDMFQTTL